jgi:DeoR family fructose operon transcriptional repressor
MDMYAVERRRWLVNRARETGRIEVAAVAGVLSVAPETVRRDLRVLQAQGLLRRVHGGAVPVERGGFEPRLAARASLRQAEKARIAAQAARLVLAVESVFLDEGSTVQALAERLHPQRPLLVATNALPVAALLAPRPNVTVLMIGGRVRGRSLAGADHWSLRMLGDLVLDLTVLGAHGVSIEHGLTCPDAAVAGVKAAAVAAGRRAVLVCDGSKFGTDSSFRFADVRALSAVVTDHSAGEGRLRRLRGLGVEAVVV